MLIDLRALKSGNFNKGIRTIEVTRLEAQEKVTITVNSSKINLKIAVIQNFTSLVQQHSKYSSNASIKAVVQGQMQNK